MNIFQRWILFKGESFTGVNIFLGGTFLGVNIFQGDNILRNKISTKIFPPQNFPFVHHYFWGGVMCQLDIFPSEFRTVEHCLVLIVFMRKPMQGVLQVWYPFLSQSESQIQWPSPWLQGWSDVHLGDNLETTFMMKKLDFELTLAHSSHRQRPRVPREICISYSCGKDWRNQVESKKWKSNKV